MKRNRICKDCGVQFAGSYIAKYCHPCRKVRQKNNGMIMATANKTAKAKPQTNSNSMQRKLKFGPILAMVVLFHATVIFGAIWYLHH